MTDRIYPRSAREMMDGWVHLPRFVDKIRLHLAGKLHSDYSENYTKGFDAAWLKAAGIGSEQFIEVVRNSLTDGEVCDWVKRNVNKSASDKEAFNRFVLNRGDDDDQAKARLEQRKREAALEHRVDVRTFVDFIDADEKRI